MTETVASTLGSKGPASVEGKMIEMETLQKWVAQVRAICPHVSDEAIASDLSASLSVERTVNRIFEGQLVCQSFHIVFQLCHKLRAVSFASLTDCRRRMRWR